MNSKAIDNSDFF